MTRVLIAPNAFKGSLSAVDVAAALAAGIAARDPGIDVRCVPVADGGDGFVDAFVACGYERVPVRASGPTGEPVTASWARHGDRAVVELAAVCGLTRLGGGYAPLAASSRGLGEVIAAALAAGCRDVVIGLGGSASTDGGVGMLQGLGATIRDTAGVDVPPGGLGAEAAATVDLHGLPAGLRAARLRVACDVTNPLTGRQGAASVYAPQKGAPPELVRRLDAALEQWADVVAAATGTDHRDDPGAGAAGGVGFAAAALLGAELVPGAALVLDALGFADLLDGADLVVTGEGRLDEQTLAGKAPATVASLARAAGIPVVAVAGRNVLDAVAARRAGFEDVVTLVEEAGGDLGAALREPARLLRRVGARLAATLERTGQ